MEKKVLKYRKQHPMCKYCKYLKSYAEYTAHAWCEAKDKLISQDTPNMTSVPRLFCSCYEVEE